MGKAWKIIGIIAGIAFLLGAVCIGVGFITGGNMDRIMDQLSINLGAEKLRMSLEQIFHDIVGIQPLN